MTGEVKGSMKISYTKLFKLLIDKNLKKRGLWEKAEASAGTFLNIGHDDPVSAGLIGWICLAPGCTAGDIAEFLSDDHQAVA